MGLVDTVANALQSVLGQALIYLFAVGALDWLAGMLVAGILKKDFTIRKLADFTVTTLGWQKLVAFFAALVLMYVHGDHFTHAAVAALATLYATAILPDLYDKLSTLLFGGKLPLSTNLVAPTK